jgi:hypothetical protein
VGLAAAAHILECGLEPVVLECGPEVGHAIRSWKHVTLFSPWAKNVDGAAERLLLKAGWNPPDPAQYTTGADLIERYLEPLAHETALSHRVRTSTRATGIGRLGIGKLKSDGRETTPFELHYEGKTGAGRLLADAVIDASGVWSSPNPAGASGLPAFGEDACAENLAYGMPDVRGADRKRYAGKTVAVLGSGHSAIGTLIELARLATEERGTEIVWILRGLDPTKSFRRGSRDQLSARGELGIKFSALVSEKKIRVESGFRVRELAHRSGRLHVCEGPDDSDRKIAVDELIICTGFRPDLSLSRELRLDLDVSLESPSNLAPLIDPNLHSCGTVRLHGVEELAHPSEPDFFIAGIKSYGRAPTFLMMTGYEQVRSIAAALAEDSERAPYLKRFLPVGLVCETDANGFRFTCC